MTTRHSHLPDFLTGCADDAAPTLYGTQTRLALQNFPPSGRLISDVPVFVRAYSQVKSAAARSNQALYVLDRSRAGAIVQAVSLIVDNDFGDQFPLALVQGGGGTSTNMNVNEVLASLATGLLQHHGAGVVVHPNDHVNLPQSTNDTYPTAMSIAILDLADPALDALDRLADSLAAKAEQQSALVRLGRTCLQDAVTLTVRDTHLAQAQAIRRTRRSLLDALDGLTCVPLGATAIGTGVGAPAAYSSLAIDFLAESTGRSVTSAANAFDSLANLDPYAAVASAIARAALVMAKVASDIRLLSSGPRGGLGEIAIPALQAGSSIMPGKVNPVVPELVMQLSYRIRGAAATVEIGVAAGELELNVMEPIIFDALVSSLHDLEYAAEVFATKCVDGLSWNEDAVSRHAGDSLNDLVAISTESGYDTATYLARSAGA